MADTVYVAAERPAGVYRACFPHYPATPDLQKAMDRGGFPPGEPSSIVIRALRATGEWDAYWICRA